MNIQLSNDRKSFNYTTHKQEGKGFFAKVTRKTKRACPFKIFNGLLYGGATMSFNRHKRRLIKQLKEKEAQNALQEDGNDQNV